MTVNRRHFLAAAAALPLTGAIQSSEDPINRLTDMTGDMQPIPASEYQRRVDKARRLMQEQKVDALFIEGGSTLFYFSGVQWGRSERTFGMLIPRSGRVAFVTPAFELGRANERIGDPGADVRIWRESESPFKALGSILTDRGIRTGKLGVEPTTRYFIVDGIGKAQPAIDVVNGKAISDACRMQKSPIEVSLMRRANEITKKAYAAAAQGLRTGMTPSDLGSRISQAHSKMGVRGGALVLFGPASAFPHGTREVHRLREGDVVLMDGGCKVHGYSSDVTRTMIFGQPSPRQTTIWNAVREAQEAAFAATRPGVECQHLDRVARKVITKAGFGPGDKYFTHRLGHGIGLDGHEEPYLVEGNRLELKPGMSFSNEPGIYIPGEFGVRHEDIMVVTDDGVDVLGPKSSSVANAL